MKCREYDYKAYNVSDASKSYWQKLWETTVEINLPPGVNFTNVLRASFAPKAFCHKITNPNCKLIKAVQRALV
jgi:hypothetical protein